MKEEFVSYSQAVALKECGFNWECDHYYWKCDNNRTLRWLYPADNMNEANDFYSAPRLWSAQKWLREVKGWHIQVRINGVRDMFSVEIWEMRMSGYFNRLEQSDGHVRLFDSYEVALAAGLDAVLELIKHK